MQSAPHGANACQLHGKKHPVVRKNVVLTDGQRKHACLLRLGRRCVSLDIREPGFIAATSSPGFCDFRQNEIPVMFMHSINFCWPGLLRRPGSCSLSRWFGHRRLPFSSRVPSLHAGCVSCMQVSSFALRLRYKKLLGDGEAELDASGDRGDRGDCGDRGESGAAEERAWESINTRPLNTTGQICRA